MIKTNFICRFLGHKFLGRVYSEPFGIITPIDYCIRCGLSKKEIMELRE